MKRLAVLALSLPFGLSLLACSAASPESPDDEAIAAATSAITSSAYAYFFVDATRDGLVARPVNNTRAACGSSFTDRCRIADVDLSPLGVSARDALQNKAAIAGEREPNAIVFVGAIDQSPRGRRTLRVVEAWRAPEPSRWSGALYQVSTTGAVCDEAPCRAATALRVNAWRASDVPYVDLAGAPAMASCRFIPLRPDGCTAAYEAAEAAMATPAGLLVAGHRDANGALVAQQYFVRVGLGAVCADGGWNYCGADQACDAASGLCSEVCTMQVCRHGRGRGVFPYERAADVQEWLSLVLLHYPAAH
jgi:hypothetical protein